MERFKRERLAISVASFEFCDQADFKDLLTKEWKKSAFYKFRPEAERNQGIALILLEMFKIRRSIKVGVF